MVFFLCGVTKCNAFLKAETDAVLDQERKESPWGHVINLELNKGS